MSLYVSPIVALSLLCFIVVSLWFFQGNLSFLLREVVS
jgi:hypothetical protein